MRKWTAKLMMASTISDATAWRARMEWKTRRGYGEGGREMRAFAMVARISRGADVTEGKGNAARKRVRQMNCS